MSNRAIPLVRPIPNGPRPLSVCLYGWPGPYNPLSNIFASVHKSCTFTATLADITQWDFWFLLHWISGHAAFIPAALRLKLFAREKTGDYKGKSVKFTPTHPKFQNFT